MDKYHHFEGCKRGSKQDLACTIGAGFCFLLRLAGWRGASLREASVTQVVIATEKESERYDVGGHAI
jgi:hypothetical protein